ncbi:hypothetical protein NL676_028874 [Syzygium grande]|nr:hypothetical protein NL676_028874 [Syzygium grande]
MNTVSLSLLSSRGSRDAPGDPTEIHCVAAAPRRIQFPDPPPPPTFPSFFGLKKKRENKKRRTGAALRTRTSCPEKGDKTRGKCPKIPPPCGIPAVPPTRTWAPRGPPPIKNRRASLCTGGGRRDLVPKLRTRDRPRTEPRTSKTLESNRTGLRQGVCSSVSGLAVPFGFAPAEGEADTLVRRSVGLEGRRRRPGLTGSSGSKVLGHAHSRCVRYCIYNQLPRGKRDSRSTAVPYFEMLSDPVSLNNTSARCDEAFTSDSIR